MKEIKVEESTKIKLQPGVCVEIVNAEHCGIVVAGASYCNVDVEKSENLTITGSDLKGVDLKLSRGKDIDVSAYDTSMRIARN